MRRFVDVVSIQRKACQRTAFQRKDSHLHLSPSFTIMSFADFFSLKVIAEKRFAHLQPYRFVSVYSTMLCLQVGGSNCLFLRFTPTLYIRVIGKNKPNTYQLCKHSFNGEKKKIPSISVSTIACQKQVRHASHIFWLLQPKTSLVDRLLMIII